MTDAMVQKFPALRRQLIESRFQNLNEMQRKAVLATEGPLLLLAGAGSGKTTVLIHRIANLVRFGCACESEEIPAFITEEDVEFLESYLREPRAEDRRRAEDLCALRPAAPWSILAITFTNKAANQLKERLEAMLGREAGDVWAMTFHAACCRILRRNVDRLGYGSNFVIYDTADSLHVIKDCLKELNLEEKSFPPRAVLNAISRAKDKMETPEKMENRAYKSSDVRLQQIARVYGSYQQKLKGSNALDFDDIILLTVRLLQEHEDVREYYQRKFRYVLIDEYQDTNLLQYRLAELLTGAERNICVVGDDDQSIYRFRGATIENILNFEENFPGARLIRLEQNYRSTDCILQAANSVIRNNLGRKGKKLWTENGRGEPVSVFEAYDEGQEAQYVAERIRTIGRRSRYGDCAVLYRTNAQSNALERAMRASGVPYRIIGGNRFYDRAEVKDMLAYLYLVNDPADDFHLRRILNVPARGIGAKTVEMAMRQASAAGKPLYHVISGADSYPSLERAKGKLLQFCHMIRDVQSVLEQRSLPEFYDALLQATGYEAMLQAHADPENAARLENVRELRSSIVQYAENAETPSLAGFLEEVALFTDIEQYDQDADAAVMMTMHAAKGLEFPHVFLTGFEEGVFPVAAAQADREELEEERRLCYVAITRAKQTLCICHAEHRMLYGHTSYGRPSRFLYELPDEAVVGKPVRYEIPLLDMEETGAFAPLEPKPVLPRSAMVTPAAPKLRLAPGDQVAHDTFGDGMVLSVTAMGNDALLEIAFESVGTKRLMANTAARYMKKK